MLVVEIDGRYHDETIANDLRREEDLRKRGWTAIHFSAEGVENDAERMRRVNANELGIPYEFKKRQEPGAGSNRNLLFATWG